MLGRTGGVQETQGVDAHFGAPAMRTARPAYPLARERLAASPRARPGRGSRLGLGGEGTPGAQVPGSGAGPCAFSHARPRSLLGSLPIESSLQEGRSAPLRGGGAPVHRPAGRRVVGHGRASASEPARGLPAWDCWTGSDPRRGVGWPCTSQPPPWRERYAEHVGRSRQRAQAPARHRPPRRRRHKRICTSNLRHR